MRLKIDMCWCGGDKFIARANVCGGLRVSAPDGKWTRKVATQMLDLLEVEIPSVGRRNFRFVH